MRFDLDTFVHVDLHRAEQAEQRVENLRPVPRHTLRTTIAFAASVGRAQRDARRAASKSDASM